MPKKDEDTEDNATRDFFKPSTFATLAGTTTAVVLLTNTLTAMTGEPPQWVPLILAMLCSVGAYVYAVRGKSGTFLKTPRVLRYGLVVLNGCLIYATAFGVQGVVASETTEETTEEPDGTTTLMRSWTSILAPMAEERRFVVPQAPHGLPHN